MRTLDRPLPAPILLDPVPTIAHWPVRPVIAIEGPVPQSRWDDGTSQWDEAPMAWDATMTGWRDATCAWTGCEIDQGVTDDGWLFPATRTVVQLDNADGSWSAIDPDGTASSFGPGTPIQIYAHGATDDWWLFDGFVARWDQRSDDTIEVEAFDMLSDLAQPIGTYTPGVNGQNPATRLTAILAAAGESARPKRFNTGTVTLTAQETDEAPLEEMQVVAASDGGVVFVDVDGTLVYLDRNWRAGRTDQEVIPIVSDNVCSAPVVVWDAVIATTDQNLADRVVLENRAGLVAAVGTSPGYVLAHTDQQWTTQIEGDVLAALILDGTTPRRIRLEEFDLYLNDPAQPGLWDLIDLRRADRIRFLHDQRTTIGSTTRVDVNMLVDGLVHTITPDGWMMTVATTRAVIASLPVLYDTGELYDTAEEYGY